MGEDDSREIVEVVPVEEAEEAPDRQPPEDTKAYSKHFSVENFWNKLTKSARKAGAKVVEQALALFYSAQSKETPLWAKGMIFGALGYFILPVDAIPDVLPVVGFSDDLTALAGAATAVATYVRGEHREQAKASLEKWFGNRTETIQSGDRRNSTQKQ